MARPLWRAVRLREPFHYRRWLKRWLSRIVNLIKKKRTLLDERDRANLVSSFHKQLLAYYDIVIYTDIGEIIVIDPLVRMSLHDYLLGIDFTYKTVIGFNVLQETGKENAIDLGQPLLEQRKLAEFDLMYCKPLISKLGTRISLFSEPRSSV